jgi:hypothetical protein
MAKTLAVLEIEAGLKDHEDAIRDAYAAYEEATACHCCCCTGECTTVFQDSTPEEQEAWLQNYWHSYRPDLFWPWM